MEIEFPNNSLIQVNTNIGNDYIKENSKTINNIRKIIREHGKFNQLVGIDFGERTNNLEYLSQYVETNTQMIYKFNKLKFNHTENIEIEENIDGVKFKVLSLIVQNMTLTVGDLKREFLEYGVIVDETSLNDNDILIKTYDTNIGTIKLYFLEMDKDVDINNIVCLFSDNKQVAVLNVKKTLDLTIQYNQDSYWLLLTQNVTNYNELREYIQNVI